MAVWQVFVPPPDATVAHLLLWSALLYLGFTMIDLPHKAWGAELSSDYDQRSRITSVREALATLGQIGILGLLVVLALQGIEAAQAQLEGFGLADPGGHAAAGVDGGLARARGSTGTFRARAPRAS